MSKPVAVLNDSITNAIDLLIKMYKIREINGAKRRLIGNDGQEYFIITDFPHVDGMEFSDILVLPNAEFNPNYEYLKELIKVRIR